MTAMRRGVETCEPNGYERVLRVLTRAVGRDEEADTE